MARQAPFTQHEAVLLLDAFLQTVSGDASRKDAVSNCSAALRQMAKTNGIEIDDTYRNVNGITFQMASMESAYRGRTIMKPATRLFTETVEMYKGDRKEYDRILKEARLMAESKKNNEAEFMAWLSTRVSPAQLLELYMAFQEIEIQAKKERLVSQSLYENIDISLFKKIKANIDQSRVFKFKHKRQMGRITSSLNFLIQYAQDQQNAAPAQKTDNIAPKHETKVDVAEKPIDDTAGKTGNLRVVSFDTIPDMGFTKPVSLSYFGELKPEDSWRTLYADFCNHLIEDYPDDFDQMLKESVKGLTKVWLVDEKHKNLLAAPKGITKGLYIETNRSALDIIKSIRWLLERCSVDYENVVIEYTKKGDVKTEEVQKTTEDKRKYKHDDKEGFYRWMLNDQRMAEASCRGYVSAIRGAEKYASEHSLESDRLLGATAEEARRTADALFSDEEFIEKNEVQHNRFRAAITKLLAYLGEDWTIPDKASSSKRAHMSPKTDTIQIETKPFEAVLTQNFSRGYRLGSSIEMKKFRRYFEDLNGYALDQESDEVEKIILLCGVEHEGRVYAPAAMLSEEMKDKLFSFIDRYFEEGKTVIYYEALFREFSEDFLDQNIYDAEMLKTYISYMAGDKYFMARSYLSNERRATVDPIEDVRTCLKEYGLPMEVDELCKTLSHIPSDRIKTLLGTHGEFVRNSKGEYFHADSFSVTDEELDNITALISEEIKSHSFISGNELYAAIKGKYPYIYEKNAMFSVIGWRDALKHKLGDRFSFTGNIISSKDKELSMSDVFAAYGAEQERFTLSELLAFAENMGSTIYFDSLYQNAARVSQDYFVSKSDVSFQVKETDKALGRFCTGNYLSLSEVKDFGIFPEASHPWTPYLLEYYVAFHSRRFYLMHGRYNRNTVVGALVKKDNVYESFDDLIIDILAESGITLQKKEALNYLSDNGYIAQRTYTGIETLMIKARAKRNMKEK